MRSGMAHSWPEVYIDGVGWIPFEPTPGYGRMRYVSWGMSSRESVSGNVTEDVFYGESEAAAADSEGEESGQEMTAGSGL